MGNPIDFHFKLKPGAEGNESSIVDPESLVTEIAVALEQNTKMRYDEIVKAAATHAGSP